MTGSEEDGIQFYDPSKETGNPFCWEDGLIHRVAACETARGYVSYLLACGDLYTFPVTGKNVQEARLNLPPVNCPECLCHPNTSF